MQSGNVSDSATWFLVRTRTSTCPRQPNGVEYQNLLAVKELRNTVVHYNPHFIEVASWRARLEQALAQTKVKVMSAGWVTNFSRVEISDWAHDSIKASWE